ncbi:DUF4229 domain-containing protein [Demequina salsinemoris]|uniref:DUF4229 domain-containing protein n=1 Tax=Demequina salsinemoris TaxID=577470 RepID=UPI0007803F32|nr:DUF4229 domain-containing protein [Demequina salsinemoris]
MKVLSYWAARTGIFLAVVAVLWLLDVLDIVTLVMAVVIAWVIGYVALPRMRSSAQTQMDGWVSRSEKGLRDLDAEEDAEADTAPESDRVADDGDADDD